MRVDMKRIALVADIEGWAFDLAAHIIKNSLKDEFQIDIFYSKEFEQDLFDIIERTKDYDLIHLFWRAMLLDFEKDEFKRRVIEKYGDYEAYVKKYVPKLSTGIYDHLFEDNIEFNRVFTRYCKNYVVSSQKLFDIYSNLENVKKPLYVLGDSFDKKKFFPSNMQRFDKKDGKLIIGWAGNSVWNNKQKDKNGNPIDFKGLHTILIPVINELQAEGYNIVLECADRNIKQIPNDEMCEYYSKIHIYVCVANKEGTPKPLLEAMGCAVPIIATDVGVVREAFGKEQQQYILGKRVIGENEPEIRAQLKEKIKFLYENREELLKLSKENLEYSKNYEIENMKNKYLLYYKNCLSN